MCSIQIIYTQINKCKGQLFATPKKETYVLFATQGKEHTVLYATPARNRHIPLALRPRKTYIPLLPKIRNTHVQNSSPGKKYTCSMSYLLPKTHRFCLLPNMGRICSVCDLREGTHIFCMFCLLSKVEKTCSVCYLRR